MRKPDRPKQARMRRWAVTFTDGETVEVEALHRAEARHYSVSLSRTSGYAALGHYVRVKSVRMIREGRGM